MSFPLSFCTGWLCSPLAGIREHPSPICLILMQAFFQAVAHAVHWLLEESCCFTASLKHFLDVMPTKVSQSNAVDMSEITAYHGEPQHLLVFSNPPQLIQLFSFIFYTDGYFWTQSPVLSCCLQHTS